MSCWWKSQHSRSNAFFEVIAKQKARAAKTKLDNTLEEQLLGGKPETTEAETTETPGWWCFMLMENHPQMALFQINRFSLACGEGAGQREDRWLYFRLVNYYAWIRTVNSE